MTKPTYLGPKRQLQKSSTTYQCLRVLLVIFLTFGDLSCKVVTIKFAAAPDDEMVDAVVASIPQEARLRGVYPDSVLRNRFLNVERVAKRVALLPDGGASLPIMLLSYIQSFFIINPANPIPPKELANQPVEVGKFNTFEILQRARFYHHWNSRTGPK
ncbi:MICOS complex subunit Mic60-like [Halyomorpha halys]|uniref:MICOS complex subunit Mic60-like n=1 Tax=Halyomorpha halys TaxID=286706 RepID=UPI0006D4E596